MFCCSGYQRRIQQYQLDYNEDSKGNQAEKKSRRPPRDKEQQSWSNNKSGASQSYTIGAYDEQQQKQKKEQDQFSFDQNNQNRRNHYTESSLYKNNYGSSKAQKDQRTEHIQVGQKLEVQSNAASETEDLDRKNSKIEPKRLFKLKSELQREQKQPFQEEQAQTSPKSSTNQTPKSGQSNKFSVINQKMPSLQTKSQNQPSTKVPTFLNIRNTMTRNNEEQQDLIYTQSSEGYMDTLELDKEFLDPKVTENKKSPSSIKLQVGPQQTNAQSEAIFDSFLQKQNEILQETQGKQAQNMLAQYSKSKKSNDLSKDSIQSNEQDLLVQSKSSLIRLSSAKTANKQSQPSKQAVESQGEQAYDILAMLSKDMQQRKVNNQNNQNIQYVGSEGSQLDLHKSLNLSENDKNGINTRLSRTSSSFLNSTKQLLYSSQIDFTNKTGPNYTQFIQSKPVTLNSGVRKSTQLPSECEDFFSKENAYDNLVYETIKNESIKANQRLLDQQSTIDDSRRLYQYIRSNDFRNTLDDSLISNIPQNILNHQNTEALRKIDTQLRSEIIDTYSKKPIMTYNTFNQVVDRLLNGFNSIRKDEGEASLINSTLDFKQHPTNSNDTTQAKNSALNSNQSRPEMQLTSRNSKGNRSLDLIHSNQSQQDNQSDSQRIDKAHQSLVQSLNLASLNDIVTGDLKLYQEQHDSISGYMDSNKYFKELLDYQKDPDQHNNSSSIKSSQTKLPVSQNPDYSHFFSGTSHNISSDQPHNILTNQSSKESLHRNLQQQRSGSLKSSGRQKSAGREKINSGLQSVKNIQQNSQNLGNQSNLQQWRNRDMEDRNLDLGRLTPMTEEASKITQGQESSRDNTINKTSFNLVSPRDNTSVNNRYFKDTEKHDSSGMNIYNFGSNADNSNIRSYEDSGQSKKSKNNVDTLNELELKNEVTHVNIGSTELYEIYSTQQLPYSPSKFTDSNKLLESQISKFIKLNNLKTQNTQNLINKQDLQGQQDTKFLRMNNAAKQQSANSNNLVEGAQLKKPKNVNQPFEKQNQKPLDLDNSSAQESTQATKQKQQKSSEGQSTQPNQQKKEKTVGIPFISASTQAQNSRRGLFRKDPEQVVEKPRSPEVSFRQNIHDKLEKTANQLEGSLSEFGSTINGSESYPNINFDSNGHRRSNSSLHREQTALSDSKQRNQQLSNQGLLYNSSLGDTIKELKNFQMPNRNNSRTRNRKAWQQDIVNFASYDQSRIYDYDLPSARKLKIQENKIEPYEPLSQQDLREMNLRGSYNGVANGLSKSQIFRDKSIDQNAQQSYGQLFKEDSNNNLQAQKGSAKKLDLFLDGPSESQTYFQPLSQQDVRVPQVKSKIAQLQQVYPQTDTNLSYSTRNHQKATNQSSLGNILLNHNQDKNLDQEFGNQIDERIFKSYVQKISNTNALLDFFIEDNTQGQPKITENCFELPSYSEMIAIDKGVRIK